MSKSTLLGHYQQLRETVQIIARSGVLALLLLGYGAIANAQSLLDILVEQDESSWRKLNTNRFQDAWIPGSRQPNPTIGNIRGSPKGIIAAWSSMAWDSARGDLLFFGGGHANYPGSFVSSSQERHCFITCFFSNVISDFWSLWRLSCC